MTPKVTESPRPCQAREVDGGWRQTLGRMRGRTQASAHQGWEADRRPRDGTAHGPTVWPSVRCCGGRRLGGRLSSKQLPRSEFLR